MSTPRLYGIPGAETMWSEIADVWETEYEPYLTDHTSIFPIPSTASRRGMTIFSSR